MEKFQGESCRSRERGGPTNEDQRGEDISLGGEPREDGQEWTSELGRMEVTGPWQEWLLWSDGDRSLAGVGGGRRQVGKGRQGTGSVCYGMSMYGRAEKCSGH